MANLLNSNLITLFLSGLVKRAIESQFFNNSFLIKSGVFSIGFQLVKIYDLIAFNVSILRSCCDTLNLQALRFFRISNEPSASINPKIQLSFILL